MKKTINYVIMSVFMMSCGEKPTDDSNGISEDTSTSILEETSSEEATDEREWAEEVQPEESLDVNVDIKPSETSQNEFDICSIASQEPIVHLLPTSEEEAAQLVLIPGVGENYRLNKSEDEGWFVLEVPSWMCDVQLYTEEGVFIELESSSDWEIGAVAEMVGECEESGTYLYSWTFHAWGSYIVHLKAPNKQEVWLASVLVSNH